MDGTYFMLTRSACVLSMKPLDILGISLLLSTVLLGKESLTNEQKIGHVLNRVAYGPSPEDLERVRNMGVTAYLQEQFHPERLRDTGNQRLQKAVADLYMDTIPGSSKYLVRAGDSWHYFKGRVEPPRDWYRPNFDAASLWPKGPSGFGYGDDDDKTIIEDMRGTDENAGYLSFYVRTEFEIEDLSQIDYLFLKVAYDDGFVGYLNGKEVLRRNLKGFPPKHDRPASSSSGTVERGEHDTFPLNKAKPLLRQGRNVLAFQVHNHRIGSSDLTLIPELVYAPDTTAKVMEGVQKVQELMHLRGVYSTKQLQAVLGEFWENHFCTDFDKVKDYIGDLPAYEQKQAAEGEDRVEKQIASEAAAIELQEYEFFYENAFGHFGDLLLYSATSPSMLIYLDSVLNLKGEPNENYAREILELYTFGVDNRYTQADIEELARCFTGWNIRKMNPEDRPGFPESARNPSTEPSLSIAKETPLLDLGPGWKYFKGKREPSEGIAWTKPGFNDARWSTGATGFGYADDDDATVLSDMQGRYLSLYLRKTLPLDLPDNYEDVVLEMTYDDGYVAYLNGHEIGRSANMERAGSPPKFNYVVPNNHEIDEGVDAIDLRRWSSIINPPPALNTLAIQGHNGSRNSTDFSIRPRVVARNYKPGSIPLTHPLGTWTFRFHPDQHDTEEKVLFKGTEHELRLPAGREGKAGIQDALDVIGAMVTHPSTSEFIIVKLINKFVSDEMTLETYHAGTAPPDLMALMKEAIATWNATPRPGHIRSVLHAILDPVNQQGPFWNAHYQMAKIKTPIEFINSTHRALGAQISGKGLTERMSDMGMELFQRDDPDGYPELGYEWMDTHNLLERLRFCQDLAVNGNFAAGEWSLQDLMRKQDLSSPVDIIEYFDQALFQGQLTERRKAVFLDFVNSDDAGYTDPVEALKGGAKQRRLEQMVGIILSTQEFQFQ